MAGPGGCGGRRRCAAWSAETSLRPGDLVLPVFVKEGIAEPQPIGSMPGVVQHTRDSLRKAAARGGRGRGRRADPVRHPRGQGRPRLGRRRPRRHRPARPAPTCAPRSATRLVLMADLCLCEYTDHGHCGLLTAGGEVGQRRHAGAVRRDRGRPGGGGRARGRAERHDGRPGGGDPGGAGRGRLTATSRSAPTRPSTPPASTARSARPPRARPQFGDRRQPTSRTRRTPRRRCAR